MRQAILLLGILYVSNERYTRYSVYLRLKGPRRHFAAADGERGVRGPEGLQRGQKTGKQEPYRADIATPVRMAADLFFELSGEL